MTIELQLENEYVPATLPPNFTETVVEAVFANAPVEYSLEALLLNANHANHIREIRTRLSGVLCKTFPREYAVIFEEFTQRFNAALSGTTHETGYRNRFKYRIFQGNTEDDLPLPTRFEQLQIELLTAIKAEISTMQQQVHLGVGAILTMDAVNDLTDVIVHTLRMKPIEDLQQLAVTENQTILTALSKNLQKAEEQLDEIRIAAITKFETDIAQRLKNQFDFVTDVHCEICASAGYNSFFCQVETAVQFTMNQYNDVVSCIKQFAREIRLDRFDLTDNFANQCTEITVRTPKEE